MKIAYIHGARSSNRSFNYLVERLPEHEVLSFAYSCEIPLSQNIERISEELSAAQPDAIIGHSMGGLIAASYKMRNPSPKLVTIATPYNGSMAATMMRLFSQLFRDVCTTNPLFRRLQRHQYDHSFLAIVTTGQERDAFRSDGVITISTQKALTGCKYLMFPINHFEVLMAPEVAEAIEDHLF